MDELTNEMRATKQRLAGLEQGARQPPLAMGADVTSDNKTRKRTEGAVAADQAEHGDSCSSKKVRAGPTSLTSFDMKAKPSALPCTRDGVLVNIGAAAPKQCLSPGKMRTRTAAGGLRSA